MGLGQEHWSKFATDPDNLVLAYGWVNSSKGDKRITVWLGTNEYSKDTNRQWALCREKLILDEYDLEDVELCKPAELENQPICEPAVLRSVRYIPVPTSAAATDGDSGPAEAQADARRD